MTEPASQPISRRGRWIAAGVIAVLMAGLIGVLATQSQEGANRAASPLIGRLVPEVEAEFLINRPGNGTEGRNGDRPGNGTEGRNGDRPGNGTEGRNGDRPGDRPDEVFNLDSVNDRWVLVNFFASWCVPCRQEHPELVAWAAAHRFDGQIVSVPFGDTEAAAKEFFAEFGGDWPVLQDNNASLAVAFGVLRPPESFLVAPGGTVIARWQGRITAAAVDEVIAEAFNG